MAIEATCQLFATTPKTRGKVAKLRQLLQKGKVGGLSPEGNVKVALLLSDVLGSLHPAGFVKEKNIEEEPQKTDEDLQQEVRRTEAANTIQRLFRGFKGRQQAKGLRAEYLQRKTQTAAATEGKVITIQRCARGFLCRLRVWWEVQARLWGAGEIQRCWRGCRGRARFQDCYKELRRREMMAVVIQRHFRTHVARLKECKGLELAGTRSLAARRIQAFTRGVLARRSTRHHLAVLTLAVAQIQRVVRGWSARRALWEQAGQHDDDVAEIKKKHQQESSSRRWQRLADKKKRESGRLNRKELREVQGKKLKQKKADMKPKLQVSPPPPSRAGPARLPEELWAPSGPVVLGPSTAAAPSAAPAAAAPLAAAAASHQDGKHQMEAHPLAGWGLPPQGPPPMPLPAPSSGAEEKKSHEEVCMRLEKIEETLQTILAKMADVGDRLEGFEMMADLAFNSGETSPVASEQGDRLPTIPEENGQGQDVVRRTSEQVYVPFQPPTAMEAPTRTLGLPISGGPARPPPPPPPKAPTSGSSSSARPPPPPPKAISPALRRHDAAGFWDFFIAS